MMNRIGAWILVGGLAVLGLPLGAAGSNCPMETSAPGPGTTLTRHLSADCTEEEREARAVDATELLQAFKEGKGIDLSGVVVRGDLSLDTLPVGPLPPELEGMKELQRLGTRDSRLLDHCQFGGAWSGQAWIDTRTIGGEGTCDV